MFYHLILHLWRTDLALHPSCEIAEAPFSWLGETGCKSGSTHTSLHTSISSDVSNLSCIILVKMIVVALQHL